MAEYQKTKLWLNTLADQKDDDEEIRKSRERFRQGYYQFRERARILTNEIHRFLPDFPLHDISHSDRLWEMADLIVGPAFSLSPIEAFVLGGAFLIHDIGMGLAAYSEGFDSLVNSPYWNDTVAALIKENKGYSPSLEEISHPEVDIKEMAIKAVLRELHAEKAEFLVTLPWKNQESNQEYFLIEDAELRQMYGRLIGIIAYSHWWPMQEIEEKLKEPYGSPFWCPRDWTVDPLLIACLLRVADISHIDASRAPSFLQTIRKPSSPSKEHWIFQEHLQQPHLYEDRLIYTSGQPFQLKDAEAWWLCYDMLKEIDRELRLVDALLADSRRRRLTAHGVTASEEPKRLAKYIRTDGWLPIDAHIQTSDIKHLIQNLGGEELYGKDLKVPLRELIQNATDALRARRIEEGLPISWGNIYVRLGKDSTGDWLEIEDNGIGMSSAVLTGPLLDFGKSYWGSLLMRQEYPGLLSKGFQSTGKYGIGFFSIFMLGEHVYVASRRFDASQKDTLVLEFSHGLDSRPLLREATKQERIRDGGTRVRIWLKTPPLKQGGFLYPRGRSSTEALNKLCAFLCPSIDANLYVIDETGQAELVISSQDWITMDGQALLNRIHEAYLPYIGELDEEDNDLDDLEDKISNEEVRISEITKNLARFSANLRPLINSSGEIVGRACIITAHRSKFPYARGTITVGGLNACSLQGIAGIITGSAVRAARDTAIPYVEPAVLAKWASEQAQLVMNCSSDYTELNEMASFIRICGGDTGNLPITQGKHGGLSFTDLADWKDIPNEILIISDYTLYSMNRAGNNLILHENVFTADSGFLVIAGTIHIDKYRWPRHSDRASMSYRVLEAIAQAWNTNLEEIILPYKRGKRVKKEIGLLSGKPYYDEVLVLRKPKRRD